MCDIAGIAVIIARPDFLHRIEGAKTDPPAAQEGMFDRPARMRIGLPRRPRFQQDAIEVAPPVGRTFVQENGGEVRLARGDADPFRRADQRPVGRGRLEQ